MAVANVTHDISIREVGQAETSALGFMLASNRRLRGHKVGAANTIAPRILSMGELTEQEAPPTIEMVWSQDNWNLGAGGINHQTDPNKLALTNKINTSTYGRISAGPELQSLARDCAGDLQYPTGFAKVGSEFWAFYERDVYLYQATGPQEWQLGTEPEAVAKCYKNGIEWNGTTYVPAWGLSDDLPKTYIYKADADCNWTLSTLASGKTAKYFAKGRNAAGDEILFGAYWSSSLKNILRISTTDATNSGLWSNDITIGDSDSEITALVNNDDTVLICKTDGVWAYFTNGTTKNLTPQFESMAHNDNFRGAFNWNGHIILPLGRGGMLELVNGKLFDISLERYFPDTEIWSDYYHNRVVAVTGDPTKLFIAVSIGNNLHILMADWLEFQGITDFRWHHLADFSQSSFGSRKNYVELYADGLPHANLAHRRIWIASAPIDDDQDTQYIAINLNEDNDFAFTNDTDAAATTTVFDAGFPHIPKAFQTFDANFLNLGAGGRTMDVQYSIDGASFVALGTLNSTSGTQELAFTDGTTGKTLQLRFLPRESGCPDTSLSAVLTKFRVKLQLRPTRVKTLDLELYLADQMVLLNGSIAGQLSADLTQLNTWSDQAAEVIVKDSEQVERDMVVLPGTYRRREVAHEFGRRPEYVVGMTFAEVG